MRHKCCTIADGSRRGRRPSVLKIIPDTQSGLAIMQSRTCRYCGETFPLNKDYFGHNPQGGFRWKCRSCVRAAVRRYNSKNRWRASERTELRRYSQLTATERISCGAQIAKRDGGYFCFYCKGRLGSDFHVDHKIPVAQGGDHAFDNFVLACMPCNQEKHAKTIGEYREWRRKRGLSVLF
jgi:5-methylcytosine-specific restriction endonuclease McrA